MRTIEFERFDLSNARVLDVGCGEGRHAHAAAITGASEVVGLDLDNLRVEQARKDHRETIADDSDATTSFLSGDATDLPFSTDTFDVIICSEVLEHLPDYHAALDELARVCTPAATLAVSVPRFGPEKVCWLLSEDYHEVEGGHVRIFEREKLRRDIESRGFEHTGSHFAHGLHSPYWWLKCLWWDRDERGDTPFVLQKYDRFLEWFVTHDSSLLQSIEEAVNPLIGKSTVQYFRYRP